MCRDAPLQTLVVTSHNLTSCCRAVIPNQPDLWLCFLTHTSLTRWLKIYIYIYISDRIIKMFPIHDVAGPIVRSEALHCRPWLYPVVAYALLWSFNSSDLWTLTSTWHLFFLTEWGCCSSGWPWLYTVVAFGWSPISLTFDPPDIWSHGIFSFWEHSH